MATKAKKTVKYDPVAPERVAEILAILQKTYPSVRCALHHENAWQLLVATILSAQCTDVRVNMVTPALFKKYPMPKSLANVTPEAVEPLIMTTGFFRNKAKSIVGAAQKVEAEFGGKVPETMEELLMLPGVARKTANVVLGSWFGKAVGVVVDTHVHRISRRLELTKSDDAKQIERDLMEVIPPEKWIDFSHQIIHHGRALCVARGPKCVDCPLETLCHAADKTWSTVEQHKGAKAVKS
jgi:endonuclease-3